MKLSCKASFQNEGNNKNNKGPLIQGLYFLQKVCYYFFMKTTVRINKHMADLGLASRREADELIAKGRVFVNNTKAVPGMQIDPVKDVIKLQGNKQSLVYYTYNK